MEFNSIFTWYALLNLWSPCRNVWHSNSINRPGNLVKWTWRVIPWMPYVIVLYRVSKNVWTQDIIILTLKYISNIGSLFYIFLDKMFSVYFRVRLCYSIHYIDKRCLYIQGVVCCYFWAKLLQQKMICEYLSSERLVFRILSWRYCIFLYIILVFI